MSKDFEFHTAEISVFEKQAEDGTKLLFIRGTASDTGLDRHGERFSSNALAKMAETARKNLTLFGDHNHSWENTLGHIVEATISGNEFQITCQLESEEAQPKVRQLWAKLKSKTRLAFSVGGRIIKTFVEEIGGVAIRVLDDIELMEVSIVGIPANPRTWVEAIAKAADALPENRVGRKVTVSASVKIDVKKDAEVELQPGADSAVASVPESQSKADSAMASVPVVSVQTSAAPASSMPDLSCEVDRLKGELDARSREIEALKSQVEHDRSSAEEAIATAMRTVGERDRELNDAKADAAKEIEVLKAELGKQLGVVTELNAELEAARSEVAEAEKDRDALVDSIQRVESGIAAKETEAKNIHAEIERLTQAVSEGERSMAEIRAAYDALAAKLKDTQMELEAMKPAAEDGKSYREDLLFEAHRLTGLVDGAAFNSDAARKKLQGLGIKDLKLEIHILRQKVDEKFPPSSVSLHVQEDKAVRERLERAQRIAEHGSPLFQTRMVRDNG